MSVSWSFDLTTAPRDGSHILMATKDGKRYLTRWLVPTKFTPSGRFDGFPENAKSLLAWTAIPDHPNHQSDSGSLASGAPGLASVAGKPLSDRSGYWEKTRELVREIGDASGHWDVSDCGSGA